MMSFKDKVVLVTGASSGIGAAIAIKFASQAAKVVIVGRNQNKLQKVASKCGNPLVVVAEITKDEECKRIVDETIAHFGQLDILVNNAGIYVPGNITDENAIHVFDKIMATNLRSAVYLTNLVAKYLIETKGNIINMSSIDGMRITDKNYFAYHTSKAALDHFSRAVALELASAGIRVNTVNPGPVKTDIIENTGVNQAQQELAWELMKKSTAFGRISEPEEVADLVLFLASDKATAITGSSFVTDNGWLLLPPM